MSIWKAGNSNLKASPTLCENGGVPAANQIIKLYKVSPFDNTNYTKTKMAEQWKAGTASRNTGELATLGGESSLCLR